MISNTVLKRSILKNLHTRNCNAGQLILVTDHGMQALYRLDNQLAARGAGAVSCAVEILLPEEYDEKQLQQLMKQLDAQCRELNMVITQVQAHVTANVRKPILTMSAAGQAEPAMESMAGSIVTETGYLRGCKPNQDIVMTKWIGIEGIRYIIDCKREEIRVRYSEEVIAKAYGQEADLSVRTEAMAIWKAQPARTVQKTAGCDIAMLPVTEGGVYAALWELAQSGEVGIDVDFRKIPVHQEVIEICEMYDINPYELASTGCLLVTSEDGCGIVRILEELGISAVIIGRTTDNHDKLIRNQEEVRYLDVPRHDEMCRFEV